MAEFWNTLTTLIQQYTIADTANVFAIVEGIATVVAAGGAIIAVVVTKKIANNQNRLFEEQMKISSAQVELSKHQNKIALYQKREELFECFSDFVSAWESTCKKILAEKSVDMLLECKFALSFLSRRIHNKEITPAENESTLIVINSELLNKEIKVLFRLKSLASGDFAFMGYLIQLIELRQEMASAISAVLNGSQTTKSIKEIAEKFLELLHREECKKIMQSLVDHLAMDEF